MAVAFGATSQVAIAKESSFGTAPGSGWHALLVASGPMSAGWEAAQDDVVQGIDARLPVREAKLARVPLSLPVDTKALPLFLYGLLGDVNSTDNLDGTWTHTITPALLLPSWSVEVGFAEATDYNLARGMIVESARISMEGRGLRSVDIDMVGAAVDISGSSSAGSPSILTGTRLSDASGTISRDGTPEAVVLGGDLTLSSPLEPDHYAGTTNGEPGAILRSGRIEASGTIRARLVDRAHLDLITNATEVTLAFRWEASPQDYIEIQLARVRFDRAEIGLEGPGGIEARLSYVCGAPSGNASVTVEARNTVASY